MKTKTVCLFPNEMRDIGLALTRELCVFLREQGVVVYISSALDLPEGTMRLDKNTKIDEFDFAICLGGDGTVLRAANELIGHKIPLLGINLGHLGYLTGVERENWRSAVQRLLEGEFSVERRMRLSARLEQEDANGKPMAPLEFKALNDVVLRRADTSGAVELNMGIQGTLIEVLKADGVVFSTPTGSTAYNLSAGGPILNPVARGYVVNPLCSHSMLARPLVLDPQDTITLDFRPVPYQEAPLLSIDGLHHVRLERKSRLYVTAAPAEEDCLMASVSQTNFYEVLKNKLYFKD